MISLPRLYAILDIDAVSARGLEPRATLGVWLEAGVRLVQLRAKSMASGPLLELANELVADAHAAGAQIIINDRADIAMMAGADGVHVGQQDLLPSQIRGAEQGRVLEGQRGTSAQKPLVIGVSTHSIAQLRAALTEPADYFAIGPVFQTASKQNPDPVVGLDVVREAAQLLADDGRPLVAIGGIARATASAVLAAGASSVAVISGLLDAGPRLWRDAL